MVSGQMHYMLTTKSICSNNTNTKSLCQTHREPVIKCVKSIKFKPTMVLSHTHTTTHHASCSRLFITEWIVCPHHHNPSPADSYSSPFNLTQQPQHTQTNTHIPRTRHKLGDNTAYAINNTISRAARQQNHHHPPIRPPSLWLSDHTQADDVARHCSAAHQRLLATWHGVGNVNQSAKRELMCVHVYMCVCLRGKHNPCINVIDSTPFFHH